ncbi:MAG: porin [Thiohalophilus sp.]|uniref:porin n=1 Tax=Thiohalophilus sp. TaxID=3028392 RepID=UPI00286FE36F|nr:porin [Thiohalophilus sp.]MDR9435274.1 porin [Thiohalophilus sp.]
MKSELKVIAAAVVTALCFSSPASANEVYGDVRLSVNSIDKKDGTSTDSQDSNASRIGFKGSYELDAGLKALYHIQAGVQTDSDSSSDDKDMFTKRFAFAGLAGNFGKVLYGTLSSPYKMAGLKIDPFYDTAAGEGMGGKNYGLSGYTNGWFDNVLAYVTPDMNGFQANAVMVMDDTDANDHHFNYGASYSQAGFTAGVQLLEVNTAGSEVDATRLTAGYKTDQWSIGASMENVDPKASADTDYLYVAGTYNLSAKNTLKLSYGDVDNDGTGMAAGVSHNLGKKTELYALYSDVDYDAATDDNRTVISVGVSHKFSIGGN